MGSNISSSSKKGATIINDDGYYSRTYLVPDDPRSLDKIDKILSRRIFKTVQVRVVPPSPVMDPQPGSSSTGITVPSHNLVSVEPEHTEDDDTSGPGSADGAPVAMQGRDGYIQVESYKRGKWSNGMIEQLENALKSAKLTRLYGRPRKLESKAAR
ncbi:hypothetical protein IAU59_005611 [Kwoniella sp. CBS 9459]